MHVKRIGAVTAALVALGLMVGVVQAMGQGSTTVLKFHDPPGTFTGVGFDANDPSSVPPIGGQAVITLRLQNVGSQFGKPAGATVGRVLLDCSVLAVNGQNIDGYCSGIAHVPDGFFTFAGNGGFSEARVNYFAITGGIGRYANDRGEIKVVNLASGASNATVSLS